MTACPFCEPEEHRILGEEGPCLALRDLYPVSPGHALIIPRRHIASFREMSEEEWAAAFKLIHHMCERLTENDPVVQGFNIGINDGPAAGQTVMHAHLHIIPRREDDVSDPRGGVRGVIPCKARYPTGI